MAVIITADVAGQTEKGYNGMIEQLREPISNAPGFIMHGAHPTDTGWFVFEVWETKEDATRFFAEYIAPTLPPGIKPHRAIRELHALILPA